MAYRFVLPQLPKPDYTMLQELCKEHDATQLEVLMSALRCFRELHPDARERAVADWRKPESVHEG